MPAAPIDVVYIAGAGRSGSTLLDRLLAASPGAVGVGEVASLWRAFRPGASQHRNCGCGKAVRACEFWRTVLQRAFGPMDGIPFDYFRGLRAHLDGRFFNTLLARQPTSEVTEYAEVLARLYEAVAVVAGAPTIIDSSKYGTYGWILARARGVRLTPLHLVRDSRAVSFSWARVVPSSLPLPLRRYPMRTSAMLWNRENVSAEALRFRTRRFLRCRYEDFVADPPSFLASLGARLGIVPPALSPSKSIVLPVNHMIGGNPVRFVQNEIQIREDDEWKTAMRPRDKLAVTAITLPLLLRYGYPLKA